MPAMRRRSWPGWGGRLTRAETIKARSVSRQPCASDKEGRLRGGLTLRWQECGRIDQPILVIVAELPKKQKVMQ